MFFTLWLSKKEQDRKFKTYRTNELPWTKCIRNWTPTFIKTADSNGDGSFTLDGFPSVMKTFSSVSYSRNDLMKAFELLDRDSDKYLSKSDLKAASEFLLGMPLDEDKIDFMLQSSKISNNQISYDQFEKLLKWV